ncbi:MAG: hypothetical protein ACI9CF_000168 [Candidatus Omnitrophota bacterium]|jgi:hypothetical protein
MNEFARGWNKWNKRPWGRQLFSLNLGCRIPYTGSIQAMILEMRSGYARIQMQDRKSIRNHLDCIHAIALTNLGELATGMALQMGLPESHRCIATHIDIDFLAKARGALIAECDFELPLVWDPVTLPMRSIIRNSENVDVAIVTTHWQIDKRK